MLYYEILKGHTEDAPALIYRDMVTTYGQLQERTAAWAAYLQQQGLRPGERVGLFSKNCREFIIAYMAIIQAGGIVVPFNFQLAIPETAFAVADAQLRFFITPSPLPMAEDLSQAGYEGSLRQLSFSELDDGIPSELRPVSMEEDDICTIIYTSGTTGRPKGAMLSHRSLLRNTIDVSHVLPIQSGDRVLCVLPMYHCFAWTTSVSMPLYAGNCVVIQENYTLDQTVSLIEHYHVAEFFGVPTMIQMFLNGIEPRRLQSVRFFVSGGAPLPESLADDFLHRFGKPVQEGYGLSEASPVVAVNPAERVKAGSIGLPLPSVSVQIRDVREQVLSPGVVGELCVRGSNVMAGYLNHPEATAETLRDGWLHTGDMAYIDEEGYIFIVDRLKDMIIAGGENVYPREIEEVLYHHPVIKEVAVVGVPDQLRGQAIAAYVVLKEGATATKPELRRFVRGKVANYKLPKYFEFIDELPKNKTGKVLKTVLRAQGQEHLINQRLKRQTTHGNLISPSARKR